MMKNSGIMKTSVASFLITAVKSIESHRSLIKWEAEGFFPSALLVTVLFRISYKLSLPVKLIIDRTADYGLNSAAGSSARNSIHRP